MVQNITDKKGGGYVGVGLCSTAHQSTLAVSTYRRSWYDAGASGRGQVDNQKKAGALC